jgi:hypothetical protein
MVSALSTICDSNDALPFVQRILWPLVERLGMNRAAVALANKLARVAWRLGVSGTVYQAV